MNYTGYRQFLVLFFIMVLMPAVSSTVSAQTFNIDVKNESLNKVLIGLGLEISFDNRALSAFTVSASRSFDNPEKALAWLLEDKPFRLEKIGKVYVVIPFDYQHQDASAIVLQTKGNERSVFKGAVVSAINLEPLEYASVSFFNIDDQLITTGITAGDGRFAVLSPQIPKKLKISYIGYETLWKEMDNLNVELGVFALNETVITLDEAVITAENNPSLNRSVYQVTPDMRHGTDHALELLNKIPGASFDKASGSARLNQFANILLLVDGIQQSHAYLNHLSPGRVQAIEVVYALSGRFVSDDYAGIIHFILKKDYTGYDIHVSNVTSLNLSSACLLTENRPSVGLTCTTRKMNFFGMYEQGYEKRNIYSSKSLTYSASELASLPTDRPNNLYKNDGYSVTGGLNYHIKPLQLLGIQADYSSSNTNAFQEYTMRRTDFNNESDRIFANRTENRINAYAVTSSLFYQGQVSDRLHLYSDFSYNYYYNDMENAYRIDEPSNYLYADMWDEHKNQTVLNVESKYKLKGRMTLESGFSNIRRQYASESSQGRGFLDYSEQRNKAFAYITGNLSEKAGFKTGMAIEHIRQRDRENENSYIRVLPFLIANYRFNRLTTVSAGYATNQAYSSLEHLSPISIAIDTFLTQIGNPVLKSAVRHQVFAELSLWNKFLLKPQFCYVSDGISETYERKEYKLYRTFDNMNFREYSLHTSYNQTLGAYLRLKNSVTLYRSEALHKGIHSALNDLTFSSEADYYHPHASFGVQLGYYRLMKKNILWQGYQMTDRDYWCMTARKEFFNKRISATLSYIPPIMFGVRYDRTKILDSPLYKEKTTMHLASYKQMLLLKISVRFDRGSAKPTQSRTDRKINER